MDKQQAIITITDCGDGSISLATQFIPEIKTVSASPAVALWKTLMDAAKAENRNGDWMTTYTGRRFYPTNPNPDDIAIEDIAHALAHICRFGGHSLEFISVAQHCVHVSRLVPREFARLALMHDAPEAYMGDMIQPLKKSMAKFKSVELQIWRAVATKFQLPDSDPSGNPVIKYADIISCVTERRDLLTSSGEKWSEEYEKAVPDPQPIVPLTPKIAEQLFLDRFAELSK
jgi:hypothetical protein